jgi:hypothetical protein
MTEMEQFIRQYAASIGLNPDIVMRTVLAEGGRSSLEPAGYARQSLIGGTGAGQEQSYGPFQMFMGGGLGNRALKAGFDPRDPAQAFNVAKFAMDVMKKEGLGHWHGWKGDPWAAHGGRATGADVAVPTTPDTSRTTEASYDPRLDTPSSGRPIGSELPGPPPRQYELTARHPPNPQTGTGGYVAPGAPTAGVEGALLAEMQRPKKSWADAITGTEWSGKPVASYDIPAQAPPSLSSAQPVPVIDPQQTEMRRQQLAMALQRLNANLGGMG